MRKLVTALVTSVLALVPASSHAAVWAVGDGAVAGSEDDAVAWRIEQEGVEHFLYLGDVYETGTAEEFANHYHPSFGRFKSITSPTPGNHEWPNRREGYDPYWGSRARNADGGYYYSVDVGGWHVVSLNSEDFGTPLQAQRDWLERDLASYGGTCTIAFAHRPRFNAGDHGEAVHLDSAYRTLEGRSVLFLAGHDHNYQRFKPSNGITQIVVGTGGRALYDVDESDSRLAASNDGDFGALRMELEPARVDFEFVRSDGRRLDSGSIPCEPHGPRLTIDRPRAGARYGRSLASFTGTARGASGQLRVTLRRVGGGRRDFTLPATRRWRIRLDRRLARGKYRFIVRARDAAGRPGVEAVSFRVR
jgi:hypothetical protein